MDQMVFPEGTPGFLIDSFARHALWKMGLNYRHGTGHGVGAALNVHEGPMSISPRFNVTYPLNAGMVVSNEPGYYEDNGFGIRIENLVAIREAETEFTFGNQKYFCFERLTLHPMQRELIVVEDLAPEERKWIDAYHEDVWKTVGPRMKDGPAKEWLQKMCKPL